MKKRMPQSRLLELVPKLPKRTQRPDSSVLYNTKDDRKTPSFTTDEKKENTIPQSMRRNTQAFVLHKY